ncbi:IS4 family transposase [[Clostridium] innocuum]|nr:IS4 family transposase [[Clostridium] innocuum]
MINILSHMKVLTSLANLESYLLKILFHSSCQWRVSLFGKNYFFFHYSNNTPTALVQARSKISSRVFQFILNELNKAFPTDNLYKGYHLIAVDGSELQIPLDFSDPDTLHKSASKGKFLSAFHLNASFDILNNRYLDMIVQGIHSKNEVEAMWKIVERFHEDNAIFIADRNYATWNNMAHIIHSGKSFLIRVKDIHSISSLLRKFNLPDEKFDLDLHITLTRKQTKDIKSQPEKYRFLSTTSTFDFIDEHNPAYELHFRVVRFKLDGSEEYESIITNLSRDEFRKDEIKEIYNTRWGIELSFRDLKYAADLCAVHAKKRESIQQEIWARMILYNISFIMAHHVVNHKPKVKGKDRKYFYAINKKMAIHHCRNYIRHRKRKGGHPPDLETLISQDILPIRPNRKCKRHVKSQTLVCFNYRFS